MLDTPLMAYSTSSPTSQWRVKEAPGLKWLHGSGDLPDINVWLALVVAEHPHHAAARAYWANTVARSKNPAGHGPLFWLCRTTMLGLVHLLAQAKVMGDGVLSLNQAYAVYEQLRALPQVGFLADPPACDAELTALLASRPLAPRLWTDAYLGALANAAGLQLVSFDADFKQLALTQCLVLSPHFPSDTRPQP